MSQIINQASLFDTVRTNKTALIDDTGLLLDQDIPRLPPGLSLIFILAASAMLWAGIILLIRHCFHLHLG